MSKHLLLTLILTMSAPLLLFADSSPNEENQFDFTPNLGISLNYSPYSFQFWGKMKNTEQIYLSALYNYAELQAGTLNLQIGSQLIVAGQIEFPIDGLDGPREKRTGLGVIPVNLQIPLTDSQHPIFLTTSAGFIVTDVSFPNSMGSRFNYILDLGLGYQFYQSNNHSYQFGYKLHHLSNGNSRMENPGIDSHMFFIKVLFNL